MLRDAPLPVRVLVAGLVVVSLGWLGFGVWLLMSPSVPLTRGERMANFGIGIGAFIVFGLVAIHLGLALGLAARQEWARWLTEGFGFTMAAAGLLFGLLAPITSGPPAALGWIARQPEVRRWFASR